jgi:hypothetical protein
MFRSLLRASAALAFAFLATSGDPAAAPGPGLAYDEIVRIVVNASPPPPGNFQADVASAGATPAAAAATPPPRRGIGLGSIASSLGNLAGGGSVNNVAGNLAQQAASNAIADAIDRALAGSFAGLASQVQSFLQPHVLKYAYLNGWERVDDVTAQTATIRKCEMGQVLKLDLARKTYTVYDPASEPVPTPAPRAPRSNAPTVNATPAPPGTAVVDLSVTTTSLGPKTIENQTTTGYTATTSLAMTQATGSCRNANASISMTEYVSTLVRPAVNSCPIARRPPLPENAEDAMAPPPTGGCRPTFTAHKSGPTIPSGQLSLYSLVTMTGGSGANAPAPAASGAGGIGFLTERGNIRTLGPTDAVLFDVPAGFTKTP